MKLSQKAGEIVTESQMLMLVPLQVTGSATINDIAPGLSATLAGTLPDVQSLKVALQYALSKK